MKSLELISDGKKSYKIFSSKYILDVTVWVFKTIYFMC